MVLKTANVTVIAQLVQLLVSPVVEDFPESVPLRRMEPVQQELNLCALVLLAWWEVWVVEKDLKDQEGHKVGLEEKDLQEKDPKDQEGHKVGLEEKDLQEKDLEDQEGHKVDQAEKDLKGQEGHKMGREVKDLLEKVLVEKEDHKVDRDLVWVVEKDLVVHLGGMESDQDDLLVRGLVDQTVLGLRLLEKGASVCLMWFCPC